MRRKLFGLLTISLFSVACADTPPKTSKNPSNNNSNSSSSNSSNSNSSNSSSSTNNSSSNNANNQGSNNWPVNGVTKVEACESLADDLLGCELLETTEQEFLGLCQTYLRDQDIIAIYSCIADGSGDCELVEACLELASGSSG